MFFESLFVSLPWSSIRHQDDRKGMEGFFLVSSVTAVAGFARLGCAGMTAANEHRNME